MILAMRDRLVGTREMDVAALNYLACPRCGGDLAFAPAVVVRDGCRQQVVVCTAGCGSYPVEGGVPRLLPELTERDLAGDEHQVDTGRAFGASGISTNTVIRLGA